MSRRTTHRTIPTTESMTVEFKSDRGPLSDRDLLETVVCLANSEGGHLYIGVEDDGTITGLAPKHQNASTLAALIANRTTPPVSVRVQLLTEHGMPVAAIEVPRSVRPVATTDGVLKRRRLKLDGQPECVPLLPHELVTRESDLRQVDFAALPIRGATLDDLSPLERVRLRQMVERYGGDRTLLGLDDASLDGALGLVTRVDGELRPTVLGLLLVGTEGALRTHVPTHEVAFQVLDGEEVVVNDFMRTPLLHTFERISERFEARINEREVQAGLFRVPVPSVDRRAFREALANALTHRDYTRLGATHVRWERDAVTVSNPGGFVEGVSLANLLTVEPRPRNPVLADAFKRVGLVDRTGRGVDLMYRGLLRYGRPAPDFARSTASQVVLRLSTADADLGFLEMILSAEQGRGGLLPVDALIALSVLREKRRSDTARIGHAIQKDDANARQVLEAMVEQGFVEAHGVKKGRTYTMSADLYRRLGDPGGYVRQVGFDTIQQEQMVMTFATTHGTVRRRDAMALCRLSGPQATRLLRRLESSGLLVREGHGRGAAYRPERKK